MNNEQWLTELPYRFSLAAIIIAAIVFTIMKFTCAVNVGWISVTGKNNSYFRYLKEGTHFKSPFEHVVAKFKLKGNGVYKELHAITADKKEIDLVITASYEVSDIEKAVQKTYKLPKYMTEIEIITARAIRLSIAYFNKSDITQDTESLEMDATNRLNKIVGENGFAVEKLKIYINKRGNNA